MRPHTKNIKTFKVKFLEAPDSFDKHGLMYLKSSQNKKKCSKYQYQSHTKKKTSFQTRPYSHEGRLPLIKVRSRELSAGRSSQKHKHGHRSKSCAAMFSRHDRTARRHLPDGFSDIIGGDKFEIVTLKKSCCKKKTPFVSMHSTRRRSTSDVKAKHESCRRRSVTENVHNMGRGELCHRVTKYAVKADQENRMESPPRKCNIRHSPRKSCQTGSSASKCPQRDSPRSSDLDFSDIKPKKRVTFAEKNSYRMFPAWESDSQNSSTRVSRDSTIRTRRGSPYKFADDVEPSSKCKSKWNNCSGDKTIGFEEEKNLDEEDSDTSVKHNSGENTLCETVHKEQEEEASKETPEKPNITSPATRRVSRLRNIKERRRVSERRAPRGCLDETSPEDSRPRVPKSQEEANSTANARTYRLSRNTCQEGDPKSSFEVLKATPDVTKQRSMNNRSFKTSPESTSPCRNISTQYSEITNQNSQSRISKNDQTDDASSILNPSCISRKGGIGETSSTATLRQNHIGENTASNAPRGFLYNDTSKIPQSKDIDVTPTNSTTCLPRNNHFGVKTSNTTSCVVRTKPHFEKSLKKTSVLPKTNHYIEKPSSAKNSLFSETNASSFPKYNKFGAMYSNSTSCIPSNATPITNLLFGERPSEMLRPRKFVEPRSYPTNRPDNENLGRTNTPSRLKLMTMTEFHPNKNLLMGDSRATTFASKYGGHSVHSDRARSTSPHRENIVLHRFKHYLEKRQQTKDGLT